VLSSSSSEKSSNLNLWPMRRRFNSLGNGSFLKDLAQRRFSE
jgi:hypothetical protein